MKKLIALLIIILIVYLIFPNQINSFLSKYTNPTETSMNADLCTSSGGTWNTCGSKCAIDNQGNQGVLCPAFCESLCECGTILGLNCPRGWKCSNINDLVDSKGYCVKDTPPSCIPNWVCTISWSSCQNGQQTRTCTDSNNCGITSGKPETTRNCVSVSNSELESYFNSNVNVKNYFNTIDSRIQSQVYEEYNYIKNGGSNNNNPYVQKIALSLWIDKNNIVPWRLNDYSSEDLASIFAMNFTNHHNLKIWGNPGCDPMYAYNQAKSFIRSNKIETIGAIIDSLRRFRHTLFGESQGTGCLRNILEGSTMNGCCVASSTMAEMIQILNIPAYALNNFEFENWFVMGHCRLLIPNIGYIPHGDNIYGNTILNNIPSKELIIPWDYVQSQIVPMETSPSYQFGVGENPAEKLYSFNTLYKYPPYLPTTLYSSCLSYAHEMGDGIATEQQIINMANSWGCT